MNLESSEFWDFFWEVRLRELQDLGKREAILTASGLIRSLSEQTGVPVRLLELGCGEGQIIGALAEAHAGARSIGESVGVDYKRQSLEVCRRNYPGLRFIEGDFTDAVLLSSLGQFEIVLLVNALHEVFSAGYSPALGQVDVETAKQQVQRALGLASGCLAPGGYLTLFDGLEPPGDPQQPVRLRFLHSLAREHFETFAREYHPFRIAYREVDGPYRVEISQRDFTRYITKSIFLGKRLWETERLESYQYFTEAEFRAAFARLGLTLRELRTLTVDYEKWTSLVEIETPEIDFPQEHILIVAQKESKVP